jgi:hypothetical protein
LPEKNIQYYISKGVSVAIINFAEFFDVLSAISEHDEICIEDVFVSSETIDEIERLTDFVPEESVRVYMKGVVNKWKHTPLAEGTSG